MANVSAFLRLDCFHRFDMPLLQNINCTFGMVCSHMIRTITMIPIYKVCLQKAKFFDMSCVNKNKFHMPNSVRVSRSLPVSFVLGFWLSRKLKNLCFQGELTRAEDHHNAPLIFQLFSKQSNISHHWSSDLSRCIDFFT